MSDEEKYPRDLGEIEKELLFFLLPENRSGYKVYRDKIEKMVIIGEGRFGEGNYVLGYEGDEPDISYSSLPMFASGQIICKKCTIQISIHEFYDDKIEFSINNITGDEIPENLNEISRWSYSYWSPGKESPFKNDTPKVINLSIQKGRAVLVISPAGRSIWLYDDLSKINHIIPVTNFINELLRGNKKIDKTKGININYIFENLDLFSDEDIVKAFVQYNKQYKKIDLNDEDVVKPIKKGIFGKFR